VAMLLIVSIFASSCGPAKPRVLAPDSDVEGLTYGEWSAKWWQYVLSVPGEENPLNGAIGANCIFQRSGNVALIAVDPLVGEPIACEVPSGMTLFLDILSAECSTLEEPPFYGGNEGELRACAMGFTFTDLQATIDGVDVEDLDQYVHLSPLFDFTIPEDNILWVDGPASGSSISNGAHLMLAPLSPGEHTIHLHASIPELEFTVDMDLELTVTEG
jgi:hypothetical protein